MFKLFYGLSWFDTVPHAKRNGTLLQLDDEKSIVHMLALGFAIMSIINSHGWQESIPWDY